MLVEIGIGDAYGCGFEAVDREFVHKNNNLIDYINHPRRLEKDPESHHPSLVAPGHYTDDTQMAIAIAEAMIEKDPWTKESLAQRFLDVFKRDERRGYTPYFLFVLMNSVDGTELLSKIGGKSTKSGAAMRAGPIGLHPDFREVVRMAQVQASVTHDSWLGRNSAVGAALMTHYFYYDLGERQLLSSWLKEKYFGDCLHSDEPFFIDEEIVECWRPNNGKPVRVHAWDCLEAAIYAIEMHASMSDILMQCVQFTGDVDTVAAIAMGPASLARDIKQDLPETLVEGLENRVYGRDYLRLLDEKLFEMFPFAEKTH